MTYTIVITLLLVSHFASSDGDTERVLSKVTTGSYVTLDACTDSIRKANNLVWSQIDRGVSRKIEDHVSAIVSCEKAP